MSTCLVSFEQPILFFRQEKRGEKIGQAFFGTHWYLYCPGLVVPVLTINVENLFVSLVLPAMQSANSNK
jgi:hypothetical protein